MARPSGEGGDILKGLKTEKFYRTAIDGIAQKYPVDGTFVGF